MSWAWTVANSRRIAETRGRISLTALHRELTERGWQSSYSTLRDWARHCLHQPRRTPTAASGTADRAPTHP
ncbi:hypothetical protein [Streptomyces sp. 4N124]|uniref:hypothetical protein n=1 Tax=Streptomyces sp. 4N124 TaxID=3457420 RepID=UPI003FCEE6C1